MLSSLSCQFFLLYSHIHHQLFFMKLFITSGLLVLFFLASNTAFSQGCVAIRGCSGNAGSITLGKGEFLAGTNFRYFKSFRHFRGEEEESQRVEQGTEVINHSYFLDFSLNYGITNRLYANAIVPFVYHNRSSMYEHGGNPPSGLGDRRETNSQGLSDVRLGLGYWLFNPASHHRYNVALGLGVKLPTGKYDYMDTFYNQGPDRSEEREAVVDQSIQPGDGGTGIAVDLQGFYMINHRFTLSSTLYYLSNPQTTNGVYTRNSTTTQFSCPDQFAARAGAFVNSGVHGLSAYLGGRLEGVPSTDLIGSSDGYRRPGYAVSVEPGISYAMDKWLVSLNVPIAVERNRTQSYLDKVKTQETGVFTQGDAAFADYLINLSVNYRFGGKKVSSDLPVNAPKWNL